MNGRETIQRIHQFPVGLRAGAGQPLNAHVGVALRGVPRN